MSHANRIFIAVITLFLALFVALGAAILSLILIGRINNVTEDLVSLRNETNVATCVASNVSRLAIRNAVKESLLALVPVGTVLTEEQQLRIQLYNKSVDEKLVFRDCSPEGIENFLENQPPDPALGE